MPACYTDSHVHGLHCFFGVRCPVQRIWLGTWNWDHRSCLSFYTRNFLFSPPAPRLMGGSSVSDPVSAFLHRWQNSSGHMTSRQLTHWLTTCWDEEAGPVWMLSWRLNFNKPGGLGGGGEIVKREKSRCKVKGGWNKFIEIEGPWEVTKHWQELRFRMED